MGMPDQWMMMLLTEKETCHEMMNRSVEASIKCLTLLHQAVGGRCFAWGIASDDSGTQQGEFIKPSLWAEMMKPHYRKLCDWVHKNTPWKTFLHSCGSVYNLIPAFHRSRHRHSESRPDLRGEHGPRPAEKGVWRQDRVLGRRVRHAKRAGWSHARGRSGNTSGAARDFCAPAAATCSTRSTTSSATCPRKTCSPCSMRRANLGCMARHGTRGRKSADRGYQLYGSPN